MWQPMLSMTTGRRQMRRTLAQKSAARNSFKILVHLKMHGNLSAKDVRILSYWARGACVQRKGASLAVKSSRTGRGFSEKFDAVLGLTEAIQSDSCDVPISGMLRSTLDRTMMPCHGAYVYEDLAKNIAETPGFEKRLRDQILA